MAKLKLGKFDLVDYLRTHEEIELSLKACRVEAGDDPMFMAVVEADIERARARLPQRQH
ncbi:MAG: XRE family transcriptional regulator [Rhodospirillales bacterium]|nr:XRE family transcriptional regulator [Rhodospirillales bacterium]